MLRAGVENFRNRINRDGDTVRWRENYEIIVARAQEVSFFFVFFCGPFMGIAFIEEFT